MIILKTEKAVRAAIEKHANIPKTVGFVPTMGALHQGHISLIQSSKKQTDLVVCSIFVNPTQFNDSKDFDKYPITIEKDILLLEQAGCDIVFLPSVKEIYPNGTTPQRIYDLGYLETILEGKYRPGHFQGVCMVVHRLLSIVLPDKIFLGQKDYQQCMVLRKLTELIDFGKNIQPVVEPTLREASGLAMSSRNMRLNEEDKERATAIYKSMQFIKQNVQKRDLHSLKEKASQQLLNAGFEKIDYVEICNATTLEPLEIWDGQKSLVVLVAAFLNGVRLIDNMLLD